jgi:PEP-CTERM motif
MRYQRFGFGSAALAAALLLGSVGNALAAEVMYDGVGFIFGQQTVTDSFSVSGPGTLTVTLQDMSFPSPLANLDLVVSTAQGLLGPETGAGTTSYRLTGGAEQVYVQALATAQGPLDAGVYGLDVMWKPTIAPVPLPASLALLASGLMLLAWQHRRAAQVE